MMDDLISRQAAIDALEAKKDKSAKGDIGCFYNTIIQNNIDALKGLPSAQPEIKTDENNHYKTGYDQGFVDACKMYEKKQPEIQTDGDMISRAEAIEIVNFECGEWKGLAQTIVNGIKNLPSAQPETNCSEIPNNSDLISRQDAIDALYHVDEYNMLSVKAIRNLPSAQPEVKPIDYRDCANAMLKMWMLDVVTDGEYYRIIDKLNKFEMERRTNDSD